MKREKQALTQPAIKPGCPTCSLGGRAGCTYRFRPHHRDRENPLLLQAFRPAPCPVENSKNIDRVAMDTVSDYQGGSLDDQFAGFGNSSRSSHLREMCELFHCSDDRRALLIRGNPAVFGYIFMRGLKLRGSPFRPSNRHPYFFLFDAHPATLCRTASWSINFPALTWRMPSSINSR